MSSKPGIDLAPARMPIPTDGLPIRVMVPLDAVIHQDEDGNYWAEVPALPGCVTGGDTVEQTTAHIAEAAEGWLLARRDILEGKVPGIKPR